MASSTAMHEWLVLLRPAEALPDDDRLDVVVIVQADFAYQARRLALEDRNIPSNWRIVALECA